MGAMAEMSRGRVWASRKSPMMESQTIGAMIGGALTLIGILVTAFVTFKKTVLEQAATHTTSYYADIAKRLEDLEEDLNERAEQLHLLRLDAEKSAGVVAQLEAQNRILREQLEATEARNRHLLIMNAELAEKCDLLREENSTLKGALKKMEGRLAGLEWNSDSE